MGLLICQSIIDRARADLVDEDAVVWSDADLLEAMNEGIRGLCSVKNDTHVLTETVTLVPGTMQELPLGGISLISVTENEISHRRITQVDRELLDETWAFWSDSAASTDVIHYCADPRNKARFVVYPPNDGTGSVWATFGAVPSAVHIDDINSEWPLNDQYEPAILMYMMAASYRRNTQRQDLQKTEGYMQKFFTIAGLSAQAQAAIAPKVSRSEGL